MGFSLMRLIIHYLHLLLWLPSAMAENNIGYDRLTVGGTAHDISHKEGLQVAASDKF